CWQPALPRSSRSCGRRCRKRKTGTRTEERLSMLTLYHNDMSLCAQKVRLGLAEKGLAWESHHLVLRAGEHQQPWYRKLNRRAVVPTLVDGDKVVPESNVILEYLEEAYPDPRLLPQDP